MSQILSPSLARCYGMTRVARVWKISRASVYRSLKEIPPDAIAERADRLLARSIRGVDRFHQHVIGVRPALVGANRFADVHVTLCITNHPTDKG